MLKRNVLEAAIERRAVYAVTDENLIELVIVKAYFPSHIGEFECERKRCLFTEDSLEGVERYAAYKVFVTLEEAKA